MMRAVCMAVSIETFLLTVLAAAAAGWGQAFLAPLGAEAGPERDVFAQDPPRQELRDEKPVAGIDLDALLAAHNRIRAENELQPLRANRQLAEAARDHARDMAEHQKLSHEGSDDSDPAKRVKRRGYRFQEVGENI